MSLSLSILVPYRSDGGPRQRIADWVRGRMEAQFADAEIIWADDGSEQFSRSGSRNEAARRANGDVFLFVDADTCFSEAQIRRGLSLIEQGAPWVLPYGNREYFNLTQEDSEALLTGPVDVLLERPLQWEHRIESWAGAVMVPRSAFELVCGYDERFNGWGGEDNAFRFALDAVVGGYTRLALENVQHIWHPRGEDFDADEWPTNRRLMKKYQTTTSREAMLSLCREHHSYH